MARNKHSTALFDVIHSAKKPPKGSPSASIPTPKWWGKDKKLPKPAATESTENAGRQPSWLSAAKRSAGLSKTPPDAVLLPPVASDPVIEPFYTEQALVGDVEAPPLDTAAEIEITHISPPEPKVRFIDRFKNRPVKPEPAPVVEEVIPPPAIIEEPQWPQVPEPEIKPPRQREDRDSILKLDPNAGDIRFRLSYGGIIALVFILLIALAIAFIAGTRSNSTAMFLNDSSDMSGGTPTTNPTGGMMAALEPIKPADATPVNPEVLQVAPRSTKSFNPSPPLTPPTAPLPIKATRDIGMIYVVIQSYAEQELAQRASDFINKAGIPCSLVQGPDGWAPRDWYSVVGLQPFAKHDPGLDAYERAVKTAGVRFTTKILDQFQPQAYTWRETSDLSQQ